MSITRTPFGEGAQLITIENRAGTKLVLTDVGASVVSLIYKGVDIVLGWDNPERYKNGSGCLGASVGRIANRVSNGEFDLNGVHYVLPKNKGTYSLHSGPDGYHTRVWQLAFISEDGVVFFMDSPDGDQGYPGHLRLTASYTLKEDSSVEIEYRGIADADTPVNIINHAYFNLNGHASGDIRRHLLRLYAERFTPSTPELIPTGEILPVEGTVFDFRKSHTIGRSIDADDPRLKSAGGYDLNFEVEGEGLRPAAELEGNKTGIRLTVLTDCPGVQLYTGNSLRSETGKNGAVYAPHSGVCLETQQFPNAVNEPAFPSCIVKAGEEYRSRTVWQLSGR